MSEKRLVLYKEPQAKERPRVTMVAGHPRIYTPHATQSYEKELAGAWAKENGNLPFTGPVVVRIVLGMKIPKSTSKAKIKKMLDRQIRPTVKPDVDNCAKSILDALNGLAYVDDTQIVTLLVRKFYTDTPKILIKVSEWVPEEEAT